MRSNQTYIYFILCSLVFFTSTSYLLYQFEHHINDDNQTHASTNVVVNILPGTMSQFIESDSSVVAEISLSTVDVSLAPPTGVDSNGMLKSVIKDHRGILAGWSQTVTCSDFSDGINTIPVNDLSITPTAINPVGASSLTGIHLGSTHQFVDQFDIGTLIYSDPGFGQGRYQTENILTLHVDKSTIPGIYSANMTVTLS